MTDSARPFLRWPGGKRWLVPYVRKILAGRTFDRYIEPFLGGGAVFFALAPPSAILADINSELMGVYRQVRRDPRPLLEGLRALPVNAETYQRKRAACPTDEIERAVRFLYLNRTAFAGMYRLNRQGEFNVPFGGGLRTTAPLLNTSLLADASHLLRRATLLAWDFQDVIGLAEAGDLVYCDPTYTVAHNNNGFVRYNQRNFSWEDQERLAQVAACAAQRGALVLISNADHAGVRALYPSAEVQEVERWCGVCPQAGKRRRAKELLLVLRKCTRQNGIALQNPSCIPSVPWQRKPK